MTRYVLYCLILSAALAGLAGCSSVDQRAEERRPFFQREYELTSHGRKTLFDRVVELDPGGLNVKVAPDYEANAPLRIAVLPFTDRGSANFVVDKIPLTFRDHQQRVRWAWTDAQRLRRSMVGYLSGREFYVINPIGIDAVLRARGITDEATLEKVTPQKLGSWLGADAVVYGEDPSLRGLLPGPGISVAGGRPGPNRFDARRRATDFVRWQPLRCECSACPHSPGYSDKLGRIAAAIARHRAGTFGRRGLPRARAARSGLRESAATDCAAGA